MPEINVTKKENAVHGYSHARGYSYTCTQEQKDIYNKLIADKKLVEAQQYIDENLGQGSLTCLYTVDEKDRIQGEFKEYTGAPGQEKLCGIRHHINGVVEGLLHRFSDDGYDEKTHFSKGYRHGEQVIREKDGSIKISFYNCDSSYHHGWGDNVCEQSFEYDKEGNLIETVDLSEDFLEYTNDENKKCKHRLTIKTLRRYHENGALAKISQTMTYFAHDRCEFFTLPYKQEMEFYPNKKLKSIDAPRILIPSSIDGYGLSKASNNQCGIAYHFDENGTLVNAALRIEETQMDSIQHNSALAESLADFLVKMGYQVQPPKTVIKSEMNS